MNELMKEQLMKETYMKVSDLATVLGVTPEAIYKHAQEIFPDAITNGITTYITEGQVSKIKERMRANSQD